MAGVQQQLLRKNRTAELRAIWEAIKDSAYVQYDGLGWRDSRGSDARGIALAVLRRLARSGSNETVKKRSTAHVAVSAA